MNEPITFGHVAATLAAIAVSFVVTHLVVAIAEHRSKRLRRDPRRRAYWEQERKAEAERRRQIQDYRFWPKH